MNTNSHQSSSSSRRLRVVALVLLALLVTTAIWIRQFLALPTTPAPLAASQPAPAPSCVILQSGVPTTQPIFLACDGKTFTAGFSGPKIIFTTWDAASLTQLHQIQLDQPPKTASRLLAISPNGERAAYVLADQSIDITEIQTGKTVRNLSMYMDPTILSGAFTPDGRLFYTVHSGGGTAWGLVGWDIATGATQGNMGTSATLGVLAAGPDGTRILFGGDIVGELQWHGNMGFAPSFRGTTPSASVAGFSPGGIYCITGHDGGQAMVWDDKTMRLYRRLHPHLPAGNSGKTSAVALSDDGTIAAVAFDNLIVVFDIPAKSEITRLIGHAGRITALLFLPDSRLVSGAEDGSVRVWTATR